MRVGVGFRQPRVGGRCYRKPPPTACRALCEGHCGGPCRSGECKRIGPTPRPKRTTHCVVAMGAVGKGEERTKRKTDVTP